MCGGLDHGQRECPKPSCRYCRQDGHLLSDCPKLREVEAKREMGLPLRRREEKPDDHEVHEDLIVSSDEEAEMAEQDKDDEKDQEPEKYELGEDGEEPPTNHPHHPRGYASAAAKLVSNPTFLPPRVRTTPSRIPTAFWQSLLSKGYLREQLLKLLCSFCFSKILDDDL
jgi:hypothetical protein